PLGSGLKHFAVTLALLDAANDKDAVVQEQVRKSILTLGNQQPDKVLSMCQDYLVKHSKLVAGHRVVVLQTIELVVKSKIDDISYPKIKSIISLASDEMTRSKEVSAEWQQAASNILVAVGNKYINDIMEEILSKFQPGVLPHFFVVQTLASLSDSNVYGMVPFLSAILGTMLPMLGMAKQDNMKWVFSSALYRFSESILEYLANLDKAPDPTVRKDTFSGEIYAAYDILFNSWLQSREPKLRLTVAEALGSMSHLMAHDKLEEQLPKLVPTVLGLYKKNPEHYIVSKSLCQVLDASVNMGSRVLETQMDSLLSALHQQVCSPMDFNNPPTIKNHNEVLRCFTILANTFPDRLMVFVLQRLENSNERNRMGSLAVLRHLINSTTSIMETKKLLILASIRQPLVDHSNKVKKRVVQVISAMAHHGYLELEGGDLLVRFIIQHCALPDTYYVYPEEVTNEALRSMCDNTLHLFTTTVGRLTDVLWPMLLCYLTPSQYSNATTPLCKSLILLANKKRAAQEPNFIIDFTASHTFQVNSAFPFRCRGHGAPSLSLLLAIVPNIHPKAEALWSTEIPQLLTHLEESTQETLDKKSWEESLLQFLSKTLVAIDDGQWSCQLAVEATRYLPTYNNSLEEKSFLYKCIGMTLQQCTSKELVRKQLQEVLVSARHNDATERAGVAMGIGLCASSHLDGTLTKLEEFGKSDAFKKASGIFGLLKDKNDVEVEKIKSTLILCYGYVALNAPEDQLLNRLDNDILRSISKHFNTKVKTQGYPSFQLNSLSLIQSVGLIAKAINTCVRKQGYLFSRKQELMGVMMDFIKAEPADALRTPVRHLVMTTCANLMYPFMAADCSSIPLTVFTVSQALYTDTFSALHELLRNVLARDLSPDGLQSVFKHIEGWLSSRQDHERERAVRTTAELLQHISSNTANLVTFHNLGALLGRLAPRCTDPNPGVRRAAIDCIYVLLHIQLRYEGFSLDYKDDSVEGLLTVREKLNDPDHSVLYRSCSELTKIISKRLPQQQLNTLIFMLFEGLVDSQSNCSRASSVVLNTLLKNRGAGLQDLVPEMLEVLHNRLQVIGEEQVKVAVAQSILILATQHLQTVITTLISYPLPFDSWSCEMWTALGADSTVARQIMEMIVEKLNVIAPFVDKKEFMLKPGMTKVATSQPLAMTCALREMMMNGNTEEAVISLFPQLFSALLVRMGSSVGVQLPKDINSNSIGADRKASGKTIAVNFDVCGVAVEALRILLARAHLDAVVKVLDQDSAWDKMKDSQQHTAGVTLLSRAMAKHAGPRLPMIVESLCPSLNNIYECQRITVTAFFSELTQPKASEQCIYIYIYIYRGWSENDEIRCASIMLLGNLSKFGSGEPVFKDQIHNVLVSLLLHLSDPNAQVVKVSACKYAMRVCAPVVGSEQITAMFQNHLHEEKGLHYGEFINDLIKYIVSNLGQISLLVCYCFKSSEINIWWNNPGFYSFHAFRHVLLHQSYTLFLDNFVPLLVQKFKQFILV
uniref:Maestro heat-like repeat family member 1 n=1 Tax=Astyanax mexicanus TaxID=7994 RepID=A0A8B9L9R4_ASTMX